jgi:hypothetical protein
MTERNANRQNEMKNGKILYALETLQKRYNKFRNGQKKHEMIERNMKKSNEMQSNKM